MALGYHTVPQVAVGLLLGGSSAYAWFTLGWTHAFSALQASPVAMAALFAATLAAMAAFAVKNVLAWRKERHALAALKAA